MLDFVDDAGYIVILFCDDHIDDIEFFSHRSMYKMFWTIFIKTNDNLEVYISRFQLDLEKLIVVQSRNGISF